MTHSKLFYLLASTAITALFTACASKPAEINVIPQPSHLTRGKGYVPPKGDTITTRNDTIHPHP